MKLYIILLGLSVAHGSYVEVTNLPASGSIHEEDAGGTFLYSVVGYSSTATQPTCTSSNNKFTLSYQSGVAPGTSQYFLETAATTFAAASSPETVTVTCTDGTSTHTGVYTVNVQANSAPVFTTLTDTVYISAKQVRAGHAFYTVSYTDADSPSPLTYDNLAVTPVAGATLFEFIDDMLFLKSDLTLTKIAQYDVTVDVKDERTTQSLAITVYVTDLNSIPVFLEPGPVTVSLQENRPGRLLVYTIPVSDNDNDPVYVTYSVTDINNNAFDLVEATGEVYLISGQTFDFETIPSYTLVVRVSDHLETSVATFTLNVNVIDVNEYPVWTGIPNSFTVPENVAGTVLGVLSTSCTDVDAADTTIREYFRLPGGMADYFNLGALDRQLTFAQDFDYDDPTLSKEVNLTVRCVDHGSLTDETVVTISVTDVNDNTPVCTPSVTSMNLQYNTQTSSVLATLGCTDADSTVNAELEYSKLGFTGGYTHTYFDVSTDGNVTLSRSFTMDFNTSFYMTFLVKDRGNPSLSTTVTLTVTYTEEPKIVTYTRVEPCFLCTTGALTIISALGLVGCMVGILLIVLTVLCCCYHCEQYIVYKLLFGKKRLKWRWCGCLRPGERKKKKKTKEEIIAAERKDREYLRARNALLGTDDHGAAGTSTSGIGASKTGDARRHHGASSGSDMTSFTLTGRKTVGERASIVGD